MTQLPNPIEWSPTSYLSRAIWRYRWGRDSSAQKLIARHAVNSTETGWVGHDYYGRADQPLYTYRGTSYRRAEVRRVGWSTWEVQLSGPADFTATSHEQGKRQTTGGGDTEDRGYTVHHPDTGETTEYGPDGEPVDDQE